MPGKTVERLTALRPNLPVIGMTGRFEERHSVSMAHILDALMEKPLNLILLMRTLSELTFKPERLPRRPCDDEHFHNE